MSHEDSGLLTLSQILVYRRYITLKDIFHVQQFKGNM